jgi:hypothetical protein
MAKTAGDLPPTPFRQGADVGFVAAPAAVELDQKKHKKPEKTWAAWPPSRWDYGLIGQDIIHSCKEFFIGQPGDRPWLNALLPFIPLAIISQHVDWHPGTCSLLPLS